MKKAIVTGANGFIGHAVANQLGAQGFEVTAVVSETACVQLNEASGAFIVYCNLENYKMLSKKLKEVVEKADYFYHFAWQGSSGVQRTEDTVQIMNIQASCEAVRAAAELGCKKFLFAASIMEYEVAAFMRTEQKPPLSSIYSAAKISADYMSRALANSFNIDYISGIISNVYGPGEISPRIINTSIRKLLKKEHISYSPGEQMYDFIYISDAARAFVLLAEKGKGNKNYYIGNREPRKLKDFLMEMRDVIAPDVEIGIGELEFDGIGLNYTEFNTNALYDDLEFEPQMEFKAGIQQTMEWIIHNAGEGQ